MYSVIAAARSKGVKKYIERGGAIVSRYGVTPDNFSLALDQFCEVLREFRCGATFPITAVVVERHESAMDRYLSRSIEFAIHGYRHIDQSKLTEAEQVEHLKRACEVFAKAGIPVRGFRSPYLQFNESLRHAVAEVGLDYISNQPVVWNALQGESISSEGQVAYNRAIDFYHPWNADQELSLPHLLDRLVEIPVSLPDDEILIDRLGEPDEARVERIWCRILEQSYARGELFTLQLHPERTATCALGLTAVLSQARALQPFVWIARLDEIANWWRAWASAEVKWSSPAPGQLVIEWTGPQEMAVLARGVNLRGDREPWINGYARCSHGPVLMETKVHPFVGVPSKTSEEWTRRLREYGYIVERTDDPQTCAIHLDPAEFPNARGLVEAIENCSKPLVRLARWPGRAQSALAITGDIDGLTLGDFVMRILGS